MMNSSKVTILIVDDEAMIRTALTRLLKPLGVRLLQAADGAAALEAVKSEDVALIISDQRMPGMTGVELLSQTRSICPETTRILLTGYADVSASIAAINDGAVTYYLTKPWDDNLLLSRVQESLELYYLTAENRRLHELTKAQNTQLRELNLSLADQVRAQTEEIRRQHEELKGSFIETIKSFSAIIEMRFQEVGSHSHRVANVIKQILPTLGLNEKDYQDIVVAAFLHDIGKVTLPDRITLKAAEDLTAAEIEQSAKHPVLGQSCLLGISGFESIGQIIRGHHENFDGSGYPDGLAGGAIPLGARLIRLTDAFDQHAFSDGYPDLKRLNQAAATLVQYSGSKFDPELVRKFIDLDIARALYHGDVSEVIGLKPDDLVEGMVLANEIKTRNGMFLLPKGAKLSRGMIGRVRKIHMVDPIVGSIQVYKKAGAPQKVIAVENAVN